MCPAPHLFLLSMGSASIKLLTFFCLKVFCSPHHLTVFHKTCIHLVMRCGIRTMKGLKELTRCIYCCGFWAFFWKHIDRPNPNCSAIFLYFRKRYAIIHPAWFSVATGRHRSFLVFHVGKLSLLRRKKVFGSDLPKPRGSNFNRFEHKTIFFSLESDLQLVPLKLDGKKRIGRLSEIFGTTHQTGKIRPILYTVEHVHYRAGFFETFISKKYLAYFFFSPVRLDRWERFPWYGDTCIVCAFRWHGLELQIMTKGESFVYIFFPPGSLALL